MSELKEYLQKVSNDLMILADLRKDLDVLTKDQLLTTILTAAPDEKVSDLIEILKEKAAEIKKEIDAKAGLVKTLAMEGPNKFKDVYYRPTCKFGCEDCIHDPAYIKATYPEWYNELFSELSPEEAALDCLHDCAYCTDGDGYDDEDK